MYNFNIEWSNLSATNHNLTIGALGISEFPKYLKMACRKRSIGPNIIPWVLRILIDV
jgi:hypothetical protein